MAELTLGVVSLIGPTYHLYKRCTNLIENYKGRGSGLRKCYLELTMTERIHRHELNQMLLLVVSHEEAERMMKDLEDPAWKERQFMDQWMVVFGDSGKTMIEVINETLRRIEREVERVEKRLNGDNGTICSRRERLNKLKKDLYWIGSEKPKIQQLVQTLRSDITDLQNFRAARQKELSTQINTPQRCAPNLSNPTQVLSRLLEIREVSKSLYDSLEEMTICPCHSINLQLDVTRDAPGQSRAAPTTKFRVILNKGDRWACGNCDCTSVIISTEATTSSASPTSGATFTSSTTNITMQNRSGVTTTRVKKRVRWSDQPDQDPEPRPRKKKCGEEESKDAITLNFNKDTRQFEFETSSGKKYKFNLDELTSSSGSMVTSVLKAVEDTSSTEQCLSTMDELCSLVEKFKGGCKEDERFLLEKRRSTGLDDEYCIYREQLERFRSTRHSLESLITSKQRPLTLSERLQICLTLSISLLYFGSYSKSRSFFQESWRSRDIYFFDLPTPNTPAEGVNRTIPYVVPRFNHDAADPDKNTCAENELLFSLGVVMIETAMGKPLLEISPKLNKGNPGCPIGEYCTAVNLVDKGVLMKEIGATFSSIVNRCIRCKFDESLYPYDLTQKNMQVAYYQVVVSQLNDLLKNFTMEKMMPPVAKPVGEIPAHPVACS